MRNKNLFWITPIWILSFFLSTGHLYAQKKGNGKVDITIESIREMCNGIDYNDRVRMAVARFSVATPNAYKKFGDQLTTMLSSALQQVNCFNVLESASNMGDLTQEIELSQSGYTEQGSSPEAGKMLGAQVILTGEVTEFSEGKNSTGAFGISITNNKARVGFILKVIKPETREVIWSRSIEVEGKKPGGFKGVRILGVEMAGSKNQNTAIADAMERGIIKGVYELVEDKDNIPFPEPNTGTTASKVWTGDNCPLLQSGNAPSIMVITSEKHLGRWLTNPTGESAIINKLVRAGFKVIDPAMYATIRNGARFKEALKDPLAAVSIAKEFGSDIIMIGEGTSQNIGKTAGGTSCRATIRLKAIQVSNAQVVAVSDGSAGAVDIAETAAYQMAYKKAGAQLANDIMEQMCTNNSSISGGRASSGPPLTSTIVEVSNTDYSNLKRLERILKAEANIKEVKSKLNGGTGTLEVRYQGDISIDELLASKAGSLGQITSFNGNKIQFKVN